MKILIVEDEMLISEMLKEILLEQNHTVMGQAMSFEEAIEVLEQQGDIEMVICDINLNKDKNGIDLAKKIKTDYSCSVIYLTSYFDDKTMSEAAETKPSAYLIKPFNATEIKAALLVAQANARSTDKIFTIKDGYKNLKLNASDIYYIQSDNNYITIFTDEKNYLQRSTLDDFISKLNTPVIARTHRSFAVNIEKIKAFQGNYLFLESSKIPLSRKYKAEIISLFENML